MRNVVQVSRGRDGREVVQVRNGQDGRMLSQVRMGRDGRRVIERERRLAERESCIPYQELRFSKASGSVTKGKN